jgi:acetoin:2,6-dichlorophenolindophenol oxidoreductase subunit alpha
MRNMKDLNFELYKRLYLIRTAEEFIQKYYGEDEMRTPMHMSMGSEAIETGICHALRKIDSVYGYYRSHALFLAKTGDTDGFFAEMYGKETGIAKGKSGSMHLNSPENGVLFCSAVVASTIPLAVGTALSNKMLNNGKITVVFFGDGATNEGVFWESLNFACLMKLPILFVCQDNGFAIHTPPHETNGFNSITDVVSKFNCLTVEDDSTDVEKIYNLTIAVIKNVSEQNMPAFVKLKYYRYLEHVGVSEDFEMGYRSKTDFLRWKEKDPVGLQRNKLLSKYKVSEAQILQEEKIMIEQVQKSVDLAKSAKYSDPSDLYKGVFA